MSWDGPRGLEAAAPAPEPHAPATRRRPRRWLTLATVVAGIVALALPFPEPAAAYGATQLTTAWNVEYSTQTLQETSRKITARGAWYRRSSSAYLGGRARTSWQRGARMSITFRGTAIALVGPRGPRRGSARIYVNGRRVKTVNAYARTSRSQQTLFVASWDSVKTRTLTVEVVGTRGHPAVTVDAFVVRGRKKPTAGGVTLPAPTPTPEPTPGAAAGPTVRVTSIPALLTALDDDAVSEIVVANGTYRVSAAASQASNSLWIGARFADRTRPVLVRAETTGGVTFDGGGGAFGGITFVEGAHHQTWQGFHFTNGQPGASGVVVFGGYSLRAPPHHITLRNTTVDGLIAGPNPPDGYPIYFSMAASPGPHDILIDGWTSSAGGVSGAHFHFYHDAESGDPAGNSNCQNVTIRNARLIGTPQPVMFWARSASNLVIEDSTISGADDFAIRYEYGSSIVLRRITSTGSGSRGFYSSKGTNPPEVTFDDVSLN